MRKLLLLLALLVSALNGCDAFVAFPNSSFQRKHRHPLWRRLSESNNFDDDEISKLIGRRSEIKRQKAAPPEKPEELSEEAMVDLDLDKLPEFKTSREPRRRSSENDQQEAENDDDNQQQQQADTPIVDFMADYEDENDFHIPNRIMITTAHWGDPSKKFMTTNSKKKLSKRLQQSGHFVAGDCQLAMHNLLSGGVVAVQTSQAHGKASATKKQSAHHILARCFKEREPFLPEPSIAELSSIGLYNWLLSPGTSMVNDLEQTLNTLGESILDVYIVQTPRLLPTTRIVAAGLAAVVESGQANYVGVSGLTSGSALRRLIKHLERYDCTLTCATLDCYSLTNTKLQGFLDICTQHNVIPLVTNPLDDGLASGVYTATNPSGGLVAEDTKLFSFAMLEKLQPLHSVLESLTDKVSLRVARNVSKTQDRFKAKYGPPPSINTDITTTQIALQWVIAKGGIPVVNVNAPRQAQEILGCLGWTLEEDEVAMLDNAIQLCKM